MLRDFSSKKVNPVLYDQPWRELIVSCRDICVPSGVLPQQKILKSFENRELFTGNFMASVMPLIVIKKSVTDRVDPLGMPFSL